MFAVLKSRFLTKDLLLPAQKVYNGNTSFYNKKGVPIYLTNYAKLHIYGKLSFKENVTDNGAGIYISDHSTITFGENSTVKFNNNQAINGTIYSKASSNVTFKANCELSDIQ